MNWWLFLAGIALFVFAMSLLEDALRELTGRPLKKFLQRQTTNKVKAIAGGAFVTAVLQSSSVVIVMLLSFVGAGVMGMQNALAVTLGANLGTTLDSWIIATLGFKVQLDMLALPLLVVALFIRLIGRKSFVIRHLTYFLVGFALMFIGLEWIKVSVTGFVETFDFTPYHDYSPYLFIPLGIVVTALIQSSLATMAITLTALHSGIMPFESAVAMVIGSEVGTTMKLVIGSWSGSADKRRVATGNFMFNVVQSIFSALLLYPIVHFIREIAGVSDPLIGLVVFQTGTNLAGILLFYPFIEKFGHYLQGLYQSEEEEVVTRFISNKKETYPIQAILLAEREIARLFMHAVRLNRNIFRIDTTAKGSKWSTAVSMFTSGGDTVSEEYRKLKILDGEILEYLVGLRQEHQQPEEIERVGQLIGISRNVMRSAKRIKDIEHNIREWRSAASDELHGVYHRLKESQSVFYSEMAGLISDPKLVTDSADQMLEKSKQAYESELNSVLTLLSESKISELDSSTLLNVYREIYSSRKSMLEALKGLSRG